MHKFPLGKARFQFAVLDGTLKVASFCHCIYPRVGDKVSLLGAWVNRGNGAVPYIRSGRKRKPFVTPRMFGT